MPQFKAIQGQSHDLFARYRGYVHGRRDVCVDLAHTEGVDGDPTGFEDATKVMGHPPNIRFAGGVVASGRMGEPGPERDDVNPSTLVRYQR